MEEVHFEAILEIIWDHVEVIWVPFEGNFGRMWGNMGNTRMGIIRGSFGDLKVWFPLNFLVFEVSLASFVFLFRLQFCVFV